MDTSRGNEATRTTDFDDRAPPGNKSVSLASHSLDEHFNPFCDNDANVAMASTSGNSVPSHFNPFRDDMKLPTSTFPSTSSSSSNVPDSARKMQVPVTQSPTVQFMERPGDETSPYRIPDYVFQRNKSRAPKEWSTASNESLFSIQMGHASFTGDLFYNKSGELSVHRGSSVRPTPTHKSNRSSDFGIYTSSGELGYSKSVDPGWYNLSGELATPKQIKSESTQIMNSGNAPRLQENTGNSVGAIKGIAAGNAQNHNLIESPSLAFGFNSPSAASCLDDRSSSTKSFTFPVLMKPDKSPSSLKPSAVQPSIQQQQPTAQESQRTPVANITTTTMGNNNTQLQTRSSFSCFSCCP